MFRCCGLGGRKDVLLVRPMPLTPKDSRPQLVEEENPRGNRPTWAHLKMAVRMEMDNCHNCWHGCTVLVIFCDNDCVYRCFCPCLTEVPIADVVHYAASADASPDLCNFTVWLRWSRVSEKSPEKDDKRKSLGVRFTTFGVFVISISSSFIVLLSHKHVQEDY